MGLPGDAEIPGESGNLCMLLAKHTHADAMLSESNVRGCRLNRQVQQG